MKQHFEKIKHHFNCGYFGTFDQHSNDCLVSGWKCIEKGLIKYGKNNEYNRKSLLDEKW